MLILLINSGLNLKFPYVPFPAAPPKDPAPSSPPTPPDAPLIFTITSETCVGIPTLAPYNVVPSSLVNGTCNSSIVVFV